MRVKTGFKIAFTILLGLAIAGSCLLFGCSVADETARFLTGDDITEISLRDSEITLVVNSGTTRRLRYSVKTAEGDDFIQDSEATIVGLEWWSEDEQVATVYEGRVAPAGVGDTTIYCYNKYNRDVFDTCEVRVESDEVFRVGIKDDVPGFSYSNPNNAGEYEGLEVEMGAMIAYELRMQVEYVPLEAGDRVGALNKGYDEYVAKLQAAEERAATEEEESESEPGVAPLADDDDLYDGYKGEGVDVVIATYSVTAERMNEVQFSSVYYDDYVRILSEKDFQQKVGATDLRGVFEYFYDLNEQKEEGEEPETLKIAVDKGTTAGASFESYASKLYDERYMDDDSLEEGEEIVDKTEYNGKPLYEIVEYDEYIDCENAIASGEADLFCGDGSILSGYRDEKYMSFLEDKFEVQHYAAATAMNSYYSEIVDNLIDEWLGDGTMAALYEKYGIEVVETGEVA